MKKALSSCIAITLFLTMSSPVSAQVTPELPFGGLVSLSTPCTCSGTLYVWFTPLYISGIPITGPLVYSPYSTILYAKFSIGVPSKWHIGTYLPGVQACWQYAAVGCVPIPSIGLMTKVGTN